MRNIIFLLTLVITVLSCNTANKNIITESELIAELEKIRSEVGIPGINLAIHLPDGNIIAVSDGYADRENNIRMNPDHKMFSGSTGKTFCAALILQLADEEKLNIDDPVSKYFGEEDWFQKIPNTNEINIKMLLNHTSGIPRYVFDDSIWKTMAENPDKTWTGIERLSYVFNAEPVHEAGKGWAYSDTNYILLGMLIEKITQNDYYDELTKRILKPYQLNQTLPANSREISGLIPGYSVHTEDLHVPVKVLLDNGKFAFNPQMEFTGGGIVCTASDLAKWGKLYYGGKVFSNKALKVMRTPCNQKTNLPDNAGYGFAAFVWNENPFIFYGHTGFFPGYVTIVEYIPEKDISIGMQWNTDKKNPEKSLHRYLDEIKNIVLKNS